MAKLSLINRELKREATVAKFAAKRAELKAIINDATRSMEERIDARLALQALPRAMQAPCVCAIVAASLAVRAAPSVSLASLAA